MNTRPLTHVPARLAIARRRIEQWRRRQPGRKRLPQELWSKAVTLAQTYGLHRTARTLGLKYDSLKKHLKAAGTDASKPVEAKPDFIELLPRQTIPSPIECVIELEDGDGVKMRMQLKGVGVSELVSFARRFREVRA